MYAKWLDLSGLDPEMRTRISEIRRKLLYDWMVRKLRQARVSDAIEKARYLMDIGESRSRILSTLMMRGRRKIVRCLEPGRRAT